jgi:hypothetical protein
MPGLYKKSKTVVFAIDKLLNIDDVPTASTASARWFSISLWVSGNTGTALIPLGRFIELYYSRF